MNWLTALKILPLGLLLLVSFIVVWRGLGKEPHDKGKIRGGGPDFPNKNLF